MFSCTPSMNSATTPFGPQFVFGQSSVPASTSSVTSFGSSTGASAGVLGASASPLSSTFRTPSSPAFGCSSSGFGASMNSSTSPFGPQYVFGQSNHLNGKVPAPTSNITSFGSSTGASVFGGPSAGVFGASSSTFTTLSSPAFGWTSAVPTSPFGSQYIIGQSSNPNGAEVSAPTIGVPPFGSQEGTSVFGGASMGVFGATASPLSSTSTLATTSSPAIWGSSSGFGGGEARLPTFGIIDSEQSTFGVMRGESRVTSYTETAEVDGAQIAGRLMSISAMNAHKDKCHEELRWEDYMLGHTGTQVRISTCDGIGSGQSALGSQYLGSKFATNSGTLEVNGGSSAGSLLSLSAMPLYQNRSHEELRWEDYQLKNRGEFGVGPACLQSNPFSNPLSRSDNSSLNPIFSPRTPSFSFPSSEASTPAFSWPPFSALSIGNSIWTTSSSKPPSTAVMAGSNSSPSLSGPFSSPTFAPSPSLASSVSSTCHSSENPFTSTPSNPFLHSFTSVFGGASRGVFGTTASPLSSTSTLATTTSPAIWGSSSGFSGGEARLPTFGILDSEQSTFGVIRGGSRVTSYTGTAEVDSTQIAGRLVSISAMHAHKDKCHEELRWEDYMLGDTGTQVRISTCDGIGSGQSALGSQYLGSKFATYTGTLELNGGSSAGSVLSVSAMPVYQNRSHEELRWEDHQLKNRGEFGVGPACLQLNPFSNPLSRSDNSSLNPVSSSITSNIFAPRTPSFNFPSSELCTPAFSWPPFSTSSIGNSIWTTTSSKPPCTAVMAGSNSSPSLSGPFSSPTFAPSPSLASSVSSTCHSSENPFTSTPSNPFLHSFTSVFGGASTGVFGATASPLSSTSTLATTSSPAIWGSSSGFGGGEARLPTFGIIDSEQSTFGVIRGGSRVTSYTGTAEVDSAQIAGRLVSMSAMHAHKDKCHEELRWEDYKLGHTGTQVRISACDGIGSGQSVLGSQYLGSKSATYTGTLEVNGGSSAGSLLSLSAMPVYQNRSHEELRWKDHQLKNRGEFGVGPICLQSNPVRSSSLLTIRHLNQLPTPKCNPKRDGPKLPFFSDAHMTPSIAKAETLLPRENPTSLVIGPTEDLMANFENSSVVEHTSIHVFENGNVSVKVSPIVDGSLSQNKDGNSDQTSTSKSSAASAEHSHKLDGVHDDHQAPRRDSAIVDEPALKIIYSFSSTGFSGGADVMKLMPKLRHTDYYVEPRIEELAVKESSKSGFCSHVKDFVVGRLGYGSIMFLGETDVRELDIESHIQFNEREVVVYMDETKKPPVGQGLNKPAEITLCNVKCIDKKTGKQYIDGPKVDKYKETLMKKTSEQGAEFVSYDPVQGDWKFKVQHF